MKSLVFSLLRLAALSPSSIPLALAAGQTPGKPSAPPQVASAAAIDTVPPKTAIETPFTIQSGTMALPGTLTLPAKSKRQIPVALIVAGSGPTDRNGNSAGALGAQNNSHLYAILPWQLSNAGIASLRYDKRVLCDKL